MKIITWLYICGYSKEDNKKKDEALFFFPRKLVTWSTDVDVFGKSRRDSS